MIILLSTPQLFFIIFTSSFIFLILLLICIVFFRKIYVKHHFTSVCYKKIYKFVLYNDYYLINNYDFKIDDTNNGHIDHIIFGEKFIYLINDVYYEGDLSGNFDDASFVYFSKKGVKQYTDNPLQISKNTLSRLSMSIDVDGSLMIGITLVNNSCHFSLKSNSKQFYIMQLKNLSALIKAIESRDIPSINSKQLDHAVGAIYKRNKNKKEK